MRCRSIDHITGYRCPAASSPVAQVCERGVRANPLASLRAGSGTCSDITAFPGLSALNVVMPTGLRRFQQSGQSHFVTFTCYHRRAYFDLPDVCDLFVQCLESVRCRFAMCVYGYVVMPEHVHLLLNEPEQGMLADAIHLLKSSFAKRVPWLGDSHSGVFWQKRYYDRNVRDEREFTKKLRYLHRNPVKRGLVKQPGDWKWSSFRHYALREVGVVEIESEWTARDRETAAQGGTARVFMFPG
jgi:putative transposase